MRWSRSSDPDKGRQWDVVASPTAKHFKERNILRRWRCPSQLLQAYHPILTLLRNRPLKIRRPAKTKTMCNHGNRVCAKNEKRSHSTWTWCWANMRQLNMNQKSKQNESESLYWIIYVHTQHLHIQQNCNHRKCLFSYLLNCIVLFNINILYHILIATL